MGILVYRDRNGQRDYVGRIDYAAQEAQFAYDRDYLLRARSAGELGISENLPLGDASYSAEEFGPFFRGVLPEGEVFGNLAEFYRVPRSNYLAMLEQIGCESIGALTFVSQSADPSEYEPCYEPLECSTVKAMLENPARMATLTASSTRLSLAGAQSKVAWFLPQGASADGVVPGDWLVPRGTAPSSHIIKISRKGEEEIALNELGCSLLAEACGIKVAKVRELPGVPGAISVERYDRVWDLNGGDSTLVRLHQEDFCQALGLQPYLKYQPEGVEANYPAMAAELIARTSISPLADAVEFSKRLLFCFAIGNADAHLKNFSLLYNREWTGRRLAPLYDVTCIPLTGYSTLMSFEMGEHRMLNEIDEHDLTIVAADMDVDFDAFVKVAGEIANTLGAPVINGADASTAQMVERILEDAAPRVAVLKRFAQI